MATKKPRAPKRLPLLTEKNLTFDYLLVNFNGVRTVIAGGMAVGVTNHILLLPTGDYTVSLDGDPTTPLSAFVELQNSSPVHPYVVIFA